MGSSVDRRRQTFNSPFSSVYTRKKTRLFENLHFQSTFSVEKAPGGNKGKCLCFLKIPRYVQTVCCVCTGSSGHLCLHSTGADVLSDGDLTRPVHKLLPEQRRLVPLKQATQQSPARPAYSSPEQKRNTFAQNLYTCWYTYWV